MKTLTQILLFCILAFSSLHAQLLLKPNEAIALVYPENTSFKKKAILLTKKQAKEVQILTQQKLESKIFTFYIIKKDKEVIAYAGLYTNKVRSKTGTYMTFISPTGHIRSIEVIAFNEPPEYVQKKRWLTLFKDKNINDNIKVKESIPNLSGATLSAFSAANTAKLMLAVWHVKYKK
ncbi:FMN-binding protein [Sulfurimonas sp. MAG313]|nr:hypothetical protein [Sulfurimonas sp. MAG313]MDF1880397.1 FMN-binding protein [Sulfurimonas sp. MAG313]